MGRHGPPPEPTKLKLLRGETRPSRLRSEPQPREMPPECPDWVIGEAREVWDRKVAELEPMGLAFKADEDALAMYCVAVANLAQAQRLLDASTPLVKGPGGTAVKNPAHTLIYNYAAVAHRLGRDFGFTPAARANMSQTERAERDDEATRLLS